LIWSENTHGEALTVRLVLPEIIPLIQRSLSDQMTTSVSAAG
jgi:hypothetical protein